MLSNHKLKSALTCTVRSQCMPVPDRQTVGQTNRRTNIMAMPIAQRFVLTLKVKWSELMFLKIGSLNYILKLENVAIIAMYCHLRPPDAIAFPT